MKNLFLSLSVLLSSAVAVAGPYTVETCRFEMEESSVEILVEQEPVTGSYLALVTDHGKPVISTREVLVEEFKAPFNLKEVTEFYPLQGLLYILNVQLEKVATLKITHINPEGNKEDGNGAGVVQFLDSEGQLIAKGGQAGWVVSACQTESK